MDNGHTSAIDPTLLVGAGAESASSPTPSTASSPSSHCSRKREASEELESLLPKERRYDNEDKKARLLARQQRNRKSAQVSREKKKAYVEQLEQEVCDLRSQVQKNRVQRTDLESTVKQLSEKVRSLESFVEVLLKTHPSVSRALPEAVHVSLGGCKEEVETNSLDKDTKSADLSLIHI